jgi:hypothetical protein
MASNWIPTNKRTGVKYPAISQEEKDAYESPNSAVKGKYTFQEVKQTAQSAPPPIEAKPVTKKEEEK